MLQSSNHTHTAKLWQKWLKFSVKAGITLLILWFLLRHMDLRSVIDQAPALNPVALVLTGVLSILNIWIASLRWFFVIKSIGYNLTLLSLWQFTFIGTFFNQVLPSSMGGDLVRFPYAHKAGMPIMSALKSVILDRLMSFSGLIILTALCIPMMFHIVPSSAFYALLTGIIAVGLLGIGLLFSVDVWPEKLLKIRATRMVHSMLLAVKDVLMGRFRTRVLLFAVLVHMVRTFIVYLLALGMSMPVTFSQCLIIVPLALLVTAIPVSLGGWGLREGAFIVAFATVGLAPEQSFVLSVLFGLITLLWSMLGGIVWMFHQIPVADQHAG